MQFTRHGFKFDEFAFNRIAHRLALRYNPPKFFLDDGLRLLRCIGQSFNFLTYIGHNLRAQRFHIFQQFTRALARVVARLKVCQGFLYAKGQER